MSLAKIDQKELDDNITIDSYMERYKTTHVRVYLMTRKKKKGKFTKYFGPCRKLELVLMKPTPSASLSVSDASSHTFHH